MISTDISKVTCPKCGAIDDNIIKFDRDIYIVRDENEFVRRKLYGCKKCENMFTYDNTPRKEPKNMNIQSIFTKIAKQCENVTNSVSIKQ
jgi:hypothetical protein